MNILVSIYVLLLGSSYQERRITVGIPLNGLTPPQLCTRLKPWPVFLTSYAIVFLCSVKMRGLMIFFGFQTFSFETLWCFVMLLIHIYLLFFKHFHLDHCGALSFSHVYFVFQTFPFGSLWCFVMVFSHVCFVFQTFPFGSLWCFAMLWIQFVFCFSDISIWIIAVLCHTCLKWLDLMDLSIWHTQLKPSVLYYWYDKFISSFIIVYVLCFTLTKFFRTEIFFTEYQMF